ncbi:hypothetical protein V6N13_089046 [Hibiscus sabdariffa]
MNDKARDENSQPEMLEGAKSMGVGAATIASAGVAVAIASFAPMMAFLILSVFRSKKESSSLIKQAPLSHNKVDTAPC